MSDVSFTVVRMLLIKQVSAVANRPAPQSLTITDKLQQSSVGAREWYQLFDQRWSSLSRVERPSFSREVDSMFDDHYVVAELSKSGVYTHTR